MKIASLLFTFILFFSLSVNAQVTAEFSAPDTICAGVQTEFIANSTNVTEFHWIYGDDPYYPGSSTGPNPIADPTYWQAGTYIVTLIVTGTPNTVKDTVQKAIYVRPTPEADFRISPYSYSGVYCLNTLFTIDRWSQHTGFDSIFWDFGDGFTSEVKSPNHQYSNPGQYWIKSQVYGKCGMDEDSIQVTIVNDPAAKPDLSLYAYPEKLCFGEEANISAYTQSQVDSIVVQTGDNKHTLLDEFSYRYSQPGVYNLMAVAYGACGTDTARTTVTVTDEIDVQPSIYPQPQDPCPGQPVRFSVSTNKLAGGSIDFGDGEIANFSDTTYELFHTYNTTGVFTATIIYHYENCIISDTLKTNINVGAGRAPYRPYISTYPSSTCPEEEFTCNLPSMVYGDTLDVYFDNGDHQRFIDTRPYNFKYSYKTYGLYDIKVIHTNACGFKDSSMSMHIVDDGLITPMSISSDIGNPGTLSCIKDSVLLYAGSSGNALSNFRWTFPDGSTFTGSQVRYAFDQPGDYTVFASATNMCNDEYTTAYTVEITDKMVNPSLDFYYYPLTNCVNNEFLFDVFHRGASKLTFDYGDGTVVDSDPWMPHAIHSYTAPGVYQVDITASNSCGVNERQAFPRVVPGPTVDFTFEDKTYRVDEEVVFTNNSSNYIEAFWVFNRDINDTTSVSSPTRSYNQPGTYDVTLFTLNEYGCFDTLTKQVRVGDGSLVNRIGNETIRFFPNPSTGNVTILPTNLSSYGTLRVIDVNGRTLLSKPVLAGSQQEVLNLSHLPSGIYFLQLHTEQSQFSGRLILTN